MKIIIRKAISFIKIILSTSTSLWSNFKIFIFQENISLGKNISIGKNVIIKTTDNGKIIISDHVSIEANSYIYAQNGIILIGKNSFIGFGSQVVALKSIKVGEDCLIAANCIIRDADHGIKKGTLINKQPHKIDEITIENDVWLGSHCVITTGSVIGTGAVVGANSVVTKDVEPYTVVGGVPAKFIKRRD